MESIDLNQASSWSALIGKTISIGGKLHKIIGVDVEEPLAQTIADVDYMKPVFAVKLQAVEDSIYLYEKEDTPPSP